MRGDLKYYLYLLIFTCIISIIDYARIVKKPNI